MPRSRAAKAVIPRPSRIGGQDPISFRGGEAVVARDRDRCGRVDPRSAQKQDPSRALLWGPRSASQIDMPGVVPGVGHCLSTTHLRIARAGVRSITGGGRLIRFVHRPTGYGPSTPLGLTDFSSTPQRASPIAPRPYGTTFRSFETGVGRELLGGFDSRPPPLLKRPSDQRRSAKPREGRLREGPDPGPLDASTTQVFRCSFRPGLLDDGPIVFVAS
jgi:hypothetical protein